MAVVERVFLIDEKIAQWLDENFTPEEQNRFINQLLSDFLQQLKIEKLNQTTLEIRKNAKSLTGNLTTTDLLRNARSSY